VVRRAVGGWVCGVVSDGCGSVSRAAEGSAATSSMIADALCRIADRIQSRGVGDWVVDDVIIELARVRKDLRARFGDDLSEYAATIVGCLISPTGGFVLHIGDGITTSYELDESTSSTVQLRKVHESLPENGELSNQTYYLSDRNWLHHVRISSFGSADLCVLCTDGAQAILYHANDLHADQLGSLLSAVDLQKPGHPSGQLSDLLDSREAQQLSSDDKSVVILVSERARRELVSGRPLQLAEQDPARSRGERLAEPRQIAPSGWTVASYKPEPVVATRSQPWLGLALAFGAVLLLAFVIYVGLGSFSTQPPTQSPDASWSTIPAEAPPASVDLDWASRGEKP